MSAALSWFGQVDNRLPPERCKYAFEKTAIRSSGALQPRWSGQSNRSWQSCAECHAGKSRREDFLSTITRMMRYSWDIRLARARYSLNAAWRRCSTHRFPSYKVAIPIFFICPRAATLSAPIAYFQPGENGYRVELVYEQAGWVK